MDQNSKDSELPNDEPAYRPTSPDDPWSKYFDTYYYSDFEYETFGHTPLITKETWEQYADDNLHTGSFMEYLEATIGICKKIDQLVSEAKNFEELKNELTLFVADRKQFVKFAEQHLP